MDGFVICVIVQVTPRTTLSSSSAASDVYKLQDHCHFWRLFRLAHCQRTTAQVTDYLKTLVTCFSPRTAVIAPTKALNALQDDLEVIIGHPVVGKTKYSKLAFIETEMQILETSSDESTLGTGVDRKQLLKRYCSVGENVRILISLTSYLPRAIELSSLKLFIVSFATFSSIIENRESVEEEDAFRILELDTSGMLEPGKNTLVNHKHYFSQKKTFI